MLKDVAAIIISSGGINSGSVNIIFFTSESQSFQGTPKKDNPGTERKDLERLVSLH